MALLTASLPDDVALTSGSLTRSLEKREFKVSSKRTLVRSHEMTNAVVRFLLVDSLVSTQKCIIIIIYALLYFYLVDKSVIKILTFILNLSVQLRG